MNEHNFDEKLAPEVERNQTTVALRAKLDEFQNELSFMSKVYVALVTIGFALSLIARLSDFAMGLESGAVVMMLARLWQQSNREKQAIRAWLKQVRERRERFWES